MKQRNNLIAQSAVKLAWQKIKIAYKANKSIIYADLVVTSFIAILISGFFHQYILLLQNRIRRYNLLDIIASGCTTMIPLTILLFIGENVLTYKLGTAMYKTEEIDEERNYTPSVKGSRGTAHKMTPEERDKVFKHGDYSERNELIIGADLDDILKMYTVNYDVYGANRNIIMFGPPGIGKSRCYAIPMILQTIRMGTSLIVTDPKGELYRETAATAKAHGYTVKVLNFSENLIFHSDTCDMMSLISKNSHAAQAFSKTVIDNTQDGKIADFWTDSEYGLFIGVILVVTSKEARELGIEPTLGGAYDLINQSTLKEFENLCGSLPPNHPALPFLNTFMNGDNTVKSNTFAGLQIRLAALGSDDVKKLVSTPDIDLSRPAYDKCIYFIGSDDSDKSMAYLVALFITLLCNNLKNIADRTPSGHLPVRVTLLLDELKNIGRIPDYCQKMATYRSRWIDIISILQNLGQLKRMYPEEEWEDVMADCYLKIVLGANDLVTSTYFETLSGMTTVEEESERYEVKAGDVLKMHATTTVTKGYTQRPLYLEDEIRSLPQERVLVFMAKQQPIEMKKIDYSNHPMCKEMRKWPVFFHCPKWIQELSDDERELFGLEDEIYVRESTAGIQLCTPEDFKHPWTKKDQVALEEYIQEFAKKERDAKKKRTVVSNVTHTATPVAAGPVSVEVVNADETMNIMTEELFGKSIDLSIPRKVVMEKTVQETTTGANNQEQIYTGKVENNAFRPQPDILKEPSRKTEDKDIISMEKTYIDGINDITTSNTPSDIAEEDLPEIILPELDFSEVDAIPENGEYDISLFEESANFERYMP